MDVGAHAREWGQCTQWDRSERASGPLFSARSARSNSLCSHGV